MHYTPKTIPDEALEALRPAFDRTLSLSAEDWVNRCRDDLAQLWFKDGLWAVTEIRDTKIGRVLHGIALAGVFNHDLIDEIEGWARDNGCCKSVITGRPGFCKTLRGYRPNTVTLEKGL